MTRLKIKLSKHERNRLTFIQNNEKGKLKARKKAKVILLKCQKKSNIEISNEVKLSKRTVINYVNDFLKNGITSITSRGNYKKSVLSQFANLFEDFEENPPSTYKKATAIIKEKYNIILSESAVRRHLNKIGIYTKNSRKKR